MLLDRPSARAAVQGNSDLTSRKDFRCKWGCHRGIANSPTWGFFPTNCGGQNPNLITRTAPPRAVWAQTGLVRGSFRLRTNFILYRRERSDPFTLSSGRGGTALAVGEVLSQTPHETPSSNKMKIQFLK